ncbi:hypothetical protein [Polyangium aurulentum]|uniref:hypothetical protein n=1 Tax=Polyangium aurulentum TaxID=2567896 RepID=UPI0010AEA8E9|nr:hypothetical protein [Polyangium aurulentum]UQA56336.1 hypothetical protein E8A73_034220 [Polyangium aurulentum]
MPPGSPTPAARPSPWGKVIVVIIVLGALIMAGIVVYLRLGTMREKREAGEARLVIEGKIKDGSATAEDLRKLQALCVRLGDAACIDRAAGLLQQRTQPEPPNPP